jgi:hypothetical protein
VVTRKPRHRERLLAFLCPLFRRYVDYEEEVSMSQSASAQAVIFDKTPTDLKSLFPKLSLR